ncbi:MAG: hypothetical protein ACK41V_12735 [Acidovorax sp.]|uniref:hypothetical protein n=1 Tax=Acidovorax sp. TaxID=1872122 RepID=UPI00391B9ADE
MQIEYVTDPVPWPKLRCAKCGAHVRQMREDLSPKHSLLVFFSGEPLAWFIVGTGVLLGFFAEAVAVLLAAWALLVPAGLVWLWFSRLRRASFLCQSCGHISAYADARNAARR